MKQFLKKPLGLAVAATLAMGGMAAYTTASAATDANALGDAAIVPYYTVKENFITGIQIINTSDVTQAVKLRLRRAEDSADVLDFNVIMSPFDHFSGYLSVTSGALTFNTSDNTCTAPQNTGTFVSPIALTGITEGYIEVIGMGQTDGLQPIDAQAKHNASGVPADCASVENNFFKAAVLNNALTNPGGAVAHAADATSSNVWEDTDNALKVSYFIRDGASGMEMGDNATHIVDFNGNTAGIGNDGLPMMTNQEAGKGLANGFTDGFDFPDLDGGGSNGGDNNRGTAVGVYNGVIRADLGASAILNNWSFNPANNVATDWVVNIPGQYLMIDPTDPLVVNTDIPVEATLTYYDREEDVQSGGTIVVSPGIPGGKTHLPAEVNVIEWGGKSVFNSDHTISARPDQSGINQPFGWANLSLESSTNGGTGLVIYNLADDNHLDGIDQVIPTTPVPVIAFAAWQRKFSEEANKNYGRIVGHSRKNNN